MLHSDGRFTGIADAQHYYQCWQPRGPQRALILISHGAAEHGGRYDIFAQHFTDLGYAVAAVDHYGHGRSDGGRCCLRSYDEVLENFALFRQQMTQRFPGLPQVLLGHSMGGLIATNYLLQHQDEFVACVLSAPAIMTPLKPPGWQMLLIRLLSRIAPNLGVVKLDASGVSRDAAEVARYVNDPLNHTGRMSARMVAEMFRGMDALQSQVQKIHLPLLILHGSADSMTAPQGSQFLFDNVSSQDKQLKIYPGLYHEIFNEPERAEVFDDVAAWLDTRLP